MGGALAHRMCILHGNHLPQGIQSVEFVEHTFQAHKLSLLGETTCIYIYIYISRAHMYRMCPTADDADPGAIVDCCSTNDLQMGGVDYAYAWVICCAAPDHYPLVIHMEFHG